MDLDVAQGSGKKHTSGDDGSLRDAVLRGVIPKSPRVVALWEGGEAHAAAPLDHAITIGRAPTCDLCIAHRSVSRLHAKLYPARGGFSIEDLGSANGTWVQGELVAPGTRAPVTFGDVVEIAGTILTLQEAAVLSPASVDTPPATPTPFDPVETIRKGSI